MTRARRQRGLALLLAVMVVAVLTLTVFPFLYEGRVERAVATNLYTTLQARHLAEGGVVIAEALLKEDARQDAQSGGPPAYDGLGETWARFNNVPIAAGGGAASMVITDEQGKLNLNRLVLQGSNVNVQRRSHLERLLVLRKQDPSLVEALIDWLDTDKSTTGSTGAEESYYLGLTPPYTPADGPLTTVAELGLVKGWTRSVVGAVAPFLTVYPVTGQPQVNVNTAPIEVLQALGLDESQAAALIACREKTPLRNASEIRSCQGLGAGDENILSQLTTRSAAFGVTVTGSFRDSVSVVHAVLSRGGATLERIYWRVE